MGSKRLSVGLKATLAIFAVAVFVTGTAASQEKVLLNFRHRGGSYSFAGLIFDASGNLYGTTTGGGAGRCDGDVGCGTVFELTPTAGGNWTETVLYSFSGTDGYYPYASLVFDGAGNLYGTTILGGTYGYGTVFELTPAGGGSWTETVLHNFNNNGTDGIYPQASLIIDAAGNLYGTTYEGGAYGGVNIGGTVFELTPAGGGSWTETVLWNFCSLTGCADGDILIAGLTFDAAGNLYGTTASGGGGNGGGEVFELTPAGGGSWTETLLYSFNGTDGATPVSRVIFDTAGNLYGATGSGGIYGYGTVFELTPAGGGSWTETVLHSFNENGTDGFNPDAGLALDASGNLYGTTQAGGANGALSEGTVFELTPAGGGSWTETVLHSFSKNGRGGYQLHCSPILDGAGNLYGTTTFGGLKGAGTVFEILRRP